ncbi:UPF0598 protein C8orf82 homolog [Parus major]|uniref:UPF0598 protein C8orf82 homolog n=1 Tax=Parus major TaxID=9157 RepID=UPI0007714411|nr:UPF0598 protein C8orf82 homolog [Parus major]
MRAGTVLRLCSRPGLRYRQGQRPGPGTREYFYYVDHQGQLFLDDTKVKNFITCFKGTSLIRVPLLIGIRLLIRIRSLIGISALIKI